LAENIETFQSLPLVEIIGTIQRRLARPIESEDTNSCDLGNPEDAARQIFATPFSSQPRPTKLAVPFDKRRGRAW
jgi:hypothetical protein